MRYMSEKSETLNFRVTPHLKAAVERYAKAENRSITSFVEKLILDYGKKHEPLKERQ